MQVVFEFFNRDGQVKPIVLDDETIVGRGEGCQLRVGSELVSREHCVVRLRDGQAWMQDLGSTNGTFLDGVRLNPHAEVPLADGAEVLIGPARARIRYDRSADQVVPSAHIQPAAVAPKSVPAPHPEPEQHPEPEPEPVAPEPSGMETCDASGLETADGDFAEAEQSDLASRETVSNVAYFEVGEETFAAHSMAELSSLDLPEAAPGTGDDDELQDFLRQFG
jgi:predicted component of type VI protein secretion system